MRVAFFNQMFALNGQSLLSNLSGHWAIHFQANPEKIFQKTNLNSTIKQIKKSNSDIIGLAEIIEGQEKILTKNLKKIGYKFILFGNGHKTKHSNLIVKVALASKKQITSIKTHNFSTINKIGGGGGVVHCKLQNKIEIIVIHFANPKNKKLYRNQIRFIQDKIKDKNKLILMGDFNLPYKKIKKFFPELSLASNQLKTCSTTPFLKIFKYQDLDHIFIKNLKSRNAKTIPTISDHKLIQVEIVIN